MFQESPQICQLLTLVIGKLKEKRFQPKTDVWKRVLETEGKGCGLYISSIIKGAELSNRHRLRLGTSIRTKSLCSDSIHIGDL